MSCSVRYKESPLPGHSQAELRMLRQILKLDSAEEFWLSVTFEGPGQGTRNGRKETG